jgi:predicted nucleic acid-binding Zn ribbon protein
LSELFNKMFGREASEKLPSDVGVVVEGVTSHSHCLRCGKAITPGTAFCSEVCKRGQRKKGQSYFWIILLMMLMLLFLFNR